jgi:hypothetical protein
MIETFQNSGVNIATSSAGYTVEVAPARGVHYSDSIGSVHIHSEWLGRPSGIMLYPPTPDGLTQARISEVLSNAARALQFMGHRVEIWPVEQTWGI